MVAFFRGREDPQHPLEEIRPAGRGKNFGARPGRDAFRGPTLAGRRTRQDVAPRAAGAQAPDPGGGARAPERRPNPARRSARQRERRGPAPRGQGTAVRRLEPRRPAERMPQWYRRGPRWRCRRGKAPLASAASIRATAALAAARLRPSPLPGREPRAKRKAANEPSWASAAACRSGSRERPARPRCSATRRPRRRKPAESF